MARGINRVTLIGNVGQDPDLRVMPNGKSVCNVSIATSETWKDKQTGEQKTAVEWHRVVFYERLAEVVGDYVRKGSKIYIEGSLRTRKYQKNGEDRYSTEIIGSQMQLLDAKPEGEQAPAPRRGITPLPGTPAAPAQGAIDWEATDSFEDDIPF